MIDETSTRPLSPVHRAQIARLSLQLRALERDAAKAEEAERGWDLDAALDQLRGRMSILIEQCRGDLAAELETERRQASERVAAARAAAATRLLAATAERRRLERVEVAAEPPIVVEPDAPVPPADDPAEDPLHGLFDDEAGDQTTDQSTDTAEPARWLAPVTVEQVTAPVAEPMFEQWMAPPAPAVDDDGTADQRDAVDQREPAGLIEDAVRVALDHVVPPSVPSTQGPIVVTLDAEAFAKAFAVALAGIAPQLGAAAELRAPTPLFVTHAPAPKRSFWADAWHADVLLSALAMVIVLVVLVAWST